MSQNKLNIPKPKSAPKERKPSQVVGWLDGLMPIQRWIGNEFPVRYVDGALWVLLLGIILIGAEHNAERQVRLLRKKKEDIENVKAAYMIKKATYMKLGKQSELTPIVFKMGLVESKEAPKKIVVDSSQ